jgi:large subunit ribosomal protein L10
VALTLERKKAVVTEVAEVAKGALSAIAAEYRGLTVDEMTALRVNARNAGVYMRVVRNTLARRAFEGTDFACMNDGLTGPLVLAFSREEPGSAARVMRDYAKDNDKLIIKLVSFGGKLLDTSEVGKLADLPTKDEAISRLMSVLKAPITKFVQTLSEPSAKLVRTLAAVRDQKQATQ